MTIRSPGARAFRGNSRRNSALRNRTRPVSLRPRQPASGYFSATAGKCITSFDHAERRARTAKRQHRRQRVGPGCDGKSRQSDPGDERLALPASGSRSASAAARSTTQADHRHRLVTACDGCRCRAPRSAPPARPPDAPAGGRGRLRDGRGHRRSGGRTGGARRRRHRAARARAATCRQPAGPRISTARAPASTAEAWTLGVPRSSRSNRRQPHDEARAEHHRRLASAAPTRRGGSRPRCGRHAPR